MSQISITNVLRVSVVGGSRGLGTKNVNTIRIFTDETPIPTDYPVERIYRTISSVADDFGTESDVYKIALSAFMQQPSFIGAGGYLVITPLEQGEAYSDAVLRAEALEYCCGYIFNKPVDDLNSAEFLKVSDTVQALQHILFVISQKLDLMEDGKFFHQINQKGNFRTKGIAYTRDSFHSVIGAYVGRALSTIFSGSRTTGTMNLKDLIGAEADLGVDQTSYERAKKIGVDLYVSYSGLPKVVSNSNVLFFDSVYSRLWLEISVIVAGFNTLAQSRTKIPQTEEGMSQLKDSVRKILDQGVFNGFMAPGAWNSPDTIGSRDDMIRNISEKGYYIYSAPISQQLQTEREAREAPLIQVALKEAGAIHSGSIILYVEA